MRIELSSEWRFRDPIGIQDFRTDAPPQLAHILQDSPHSVDIWIDYGSGPGSQWTAGPYEMTLQAPLRIEPQ
jgi:hypothetical protein